MRDTLFYYLERYQNYFVYGLFAIAIALFAMLKFGGKKQTGVGGMNLESAFLSWKSAESADGPELKELARLVEKYPAASGVYGTRVVEGLIARGAAENTGLFARGVLARTEVQAPEIAAFARGSLLIERGQFEEALESAATLKTALEEKNEGESLLYGYTLLRMVSLCRELGFDDGLAREQLGLFLKAESAAAAALKNVFSEKGFSLKDFLALRPARVHDEAHSSMESHQ